MYRIGLTGGIGSGKSTVSTCLRLLGAPVLDADAISHALTAPGSEALPSIRTRFGDGVFDGDVLDRKKLAAIVFADRYARRDLEGIVHPLVFARIESEMRRLAEAGTPAVVLDVPLLFETGMDQKVDETWLVCVPEAEQIRRIMVRDGMSEQEARARVASQMSLRSKVLRANRVISTMRTVEETRLEVRALWEKTLAALAAEHARKGAPLA